jgi:hypothetical protein
MELFLTHRMALVNPVRIRMIAPSFDTRFALLERVARDLVGRV